MMLPRELSVLTCQCLLGIAVRLDNDALCEAVNEAQARLQDSGVLPQLVKKWLEA